MFFSKAYKGALNYLTNLVDKILSVNIWILVKILILCQILDGVLTYAGVSEHGTKIEGNPLLKYFMDIHHPGLVLISTKLFGIILLLLLCKVYSVGRKEHSFVIPCLYVVIFVYIWFAIIPWTVFFFIR